MVTKDMTVLIAFEGANSMVAPVPIAVMSTPIIKAGDRIVSVIAVSGFSAWTDAAALFELPIPRDGVVTQKIGSNLFGAFFVAIVERGERLDAEVNIQGVS